MDRMKPTLFRVAFAPHLRWGDIFRTQAGRAWWCVPRQNNGHVVMAWPYTGARKRGCPFSRPLSEENQDRLEAVRVAVYGRQDYDDEECRS